MSVNNKKLDEDFLKRFEPGPKRQFPLRMVNEVWDDAEHAKEILERRSKKSIPMNTYILAAMAMMYEQIVSREYNEKGKRKK